eukprot:SAG11_NODE_1055_length_6017_cov_1.548496_3_plen_87_part_00
MQVLAQDLGLSEAECAFFSDNGLDSEQSERSSGVWAAAGAVPQPHLGAGAGDSSKRFGLVYLLVVRSSSARSLRAHSCPAEPPSLV